MFEALYPMTDAQIAAAQGLKYMVGRAKKGGKFKHLTAEQVKAHLEGQESEFEVIELWEKLPSTQAFSDLMDRAMDKAAQPVALEHSGNIEVSWKGEK